MFLKPEGFFNATGKQYNRFTCWKAWMQAFLPVEKEKASLVFIRATAFLRLHG